MGLAAAIALSLLVAAPGASAGFPSTSKVPTRVFLDYSAETAELSGRVASHGRCEPDRRILVFRRIEGEDPVVARTRTDAGAEFSATIQPDGERYYVRVGERRIVSSGGRHLTVCKERRSKAIEATIDIG